MNPSTAEPGVVLRSRYREACLEARLVLDAAGIESELLYADGWWLLLVDEMDLPRCAEELEAYHRENRSRPRRRIIKVPVLSSGRVGLLAYAAVLLAVSVMANGWAFGFDWFDAGAMQAARVTDGEWWRTVTALTLHGDAGHLTANLVFGTVFGLLAAQALGSGVAWCGILAAGALGNALNAVIQQPGHSSIGASTAVFAALAIVVAHSMRYWTLLAGGALRRWSPLVGGVLLLAYTGTGGERTDVAAHLTGFIAGLAIGWVGSLMPPEQLRRMRVQSTAAISAMGLLMLAWGLALVS
jgi:membrane associated rhomboid family serine protease